MKFFVLILGLVATTAFAKAKSRGPASVDPETKMLSELERTLETQAATADQKANAEAAILDRSNMQAADRPQYRVED